MSRDSSVGIAAGNGMDGRGLGVQFPVGSMNFSAQCAGPLLGAPKLLSNRYPSPFLGGGGSGLGVKFTSS
jgi:hypothetical protein